MFPVHFDVVPIFTEAAKAYGIPPEIMARASLLGYPVHQLSPLVAANYVLIGLGGVKVGGHQKFTLKWACLLAVVMILTSSLFFWPVGDMRSRLQAVPQSVTRRAILGCGITLIGAAGTLRAVWAKMRSTTMRSARYAFVGCRTTKERNARGEGIQVYRVDPSSGEWTHVQLLRNLVNPSFLAFDKNREFLYAVHGDMSEISSFKLSPQTGELQFLNRQSTNGKNPAHLVVDDSNRFVIVANYATGSVAVLPRNADGSLGTVQQLEDLPGTAGPHKVDQGSSHPHHVVYDRKRQFLVIPDKGLDRIFSFRFDGPAGRLTPAPAPYVQVRPGAGPRHIAFHPTAPVVFVAHELDSSVGVYRYDGARGELTPFQVLPSTPDTHAGANTAAEIEVSASGRFVYVSNRGHDSVGVFSVDAGSGRLTPVEWISTEGKGPRFFTIDPSGKWLYAANEGTDTIVQFQIHSETGRLTRASQTIRTGSPVCIVFTA